MFKLYEKYIVHISRVSLLPYLEFVAARSPITAEKNRASNAYFKRIFC
jgi:hypothetical protein